MLKYVGRGTSLPGIPARDLTDNEAKQHNEKFLVKSGLYEQPRRTRADQDHDVGTDKVSSVRQTPVYDSDGT